MAHAGPTYAEAYSGYNFTTGHDGLPRLTHDASTPSSNAAWHEHSVGATTTTTTTATATAPLPLPLPLPLPQPQPPPSTKGRKGADALDGLRALPEIRAIPFVPGKELPIEKAAESPRPQTRGAFLLSTRGKIVDPPCAHCATGAGRFSKCVNLPPWFHGACSTCQMASRGHLCTLRTAAEELAPESKKASSHQQQSQQTAASPSPTIDDHPRPQSSQKRKREDPRPTSLTKPYVSVYGPSGNEPGSAAQSPTFPAGAQSTSASQYNTSRYTAPPAPMAAAAHTYRQSAGDSANVRSGAPSLLDYVYPKQNPPNGTKRLHISQQAQAESPQMARQGNGGMQQYHEGGRNSPYTPVSNPQLHQQTAYEKSGTQAQVYTAPSMAPMPIFDTLPRKKQKKILEVIGGIQSGIRSVRQQTDSLQRQLDALHEVLGIDLDGEGEGDDVGLE